MNNNLKKEKQQNTLFTKVVATARKQKPTKRNCFRHVGDIIFRRSAAHNKWRPQLVASSSFRLKIPWTGTQEAETRQHESLVESLSTGEFFIIKIKTFTLFLSDLVK